MREEADLPEVRRGHGAEEYGMAYALLASFLVAGLSGLMHGSLLAAGFFVVFHLIPMLPAAIFAFRPAAFSGINSEKHQKAGLF